ncbi:hypothetical protein Taro_038626 [Colocasia esculenta]|uniref:Uncharacterized protein n=1 Tax=Colocasia esculenta TaxID=4460 RepID=A0A843WMS7_COLES|nr:hypothetical protein [Colocasia esculenta]
MVLHLAVVAKLKLLAAVGHGHGTGQLLAALLGPFVLKLPISRYVPRALGDVVFSCRLFLFRLSRIFLEEGADAAGGGRWGRALRLVSGRLDEGRRIRASEPDEASLYEYTENNPIGGRAGHNDLGEKAKSHVSSSKMDLAMVRCATSLGEVGLLKKKKKKKKKKFTETLTSKHSKSFHGV